MSTGHIWRIVTYCEYRVRTREYITWGLCECETFSVIFRIRPPDILGVPGAEELYYRNQTDDGGELTLGTITTLMSLIFAREGKEYGGWGNPNQTRRNVHIISFHSIQLIEKTCLLFFFLSFFLSFP